MFALISLGFTLSLDNFRTSIVLGGLKPTLLRSVKTSAIFGLWDGLAPLVGILIGHYLSDKVDSTSDTMPGTRSAARSPSSYPASAPIC
jgi:manganese efflux pump family protein